jgi:transposase-like protein
MDLDSFVKYTYPTVFPDTHYCPICDSELTEVDGSEENGRSKFTCTDSCIVEECYYNGTSEDVTVNMQTAYRYIRDMYSEDVDVVMDKYYHNKLSDPVLEKILDLIRKKDTSSFKQTSEGVRVVKYNNSFVVASELLNYTLCFEDENRVCVAKVPVEDATFYSPDEVESFIGVS